MHAFTTPCRRALQWSFAGALTVACATQVDEPARLGQEPSGGTAGAAGTAGSGAGSPAETAGSGGSSAGGPGSAGTAMNGGSATSGGALAGGGMGGSSAGVGGTGGAGGAGKAGGGAASGGAGGVSGAGGTSGSGGKGGVGGGSSGSAGAGGTGVTKCAKNPIPSKSNWVVTASSSNSPDPPANACDNMLTTRWSSGKDQAGSEWLQLDFGVTVTLTKLTLQLGSSPNDYPRKYAARFSAKPLDNAAPVLASGMGAAGTDTVMTFPVGSTGRYVLIDQLGAATGLWWSVAEILTACAD